MIDELVKANNLDRDKGFEIILYAGFCKANEMMKTTTKEKVNAVDKIKEYVP